MSSDVDFSFQHRFECEVLDELPRGPVPQRRFFPGDKASGPDVVIVRVAPETGDTWVGMFAFGKFGKAGGSRVLSMPNSEMLCVIARGAGFVVSAPKPDTRETVRAIPIMDVRVIPAVGLVVFANYTELLAYGESGVRWQTKRLAWDGLKNVAVGDRTLFGEYWDIREEGVRKLEVDLATGAARGGVET